MALLIPARSFEMYFHSDFSIGDWGYRITIMGLIQPGYVEPEAVEPEAQAEPTNNLVLESSHPYAPNSDQFTRVHIPGSNAYLVVFDDACAMEDGYDYIRCVCVCVYVCMYVCMLVKATSKLWLRRIDEQRSLLMRAQYRKSNIKFGCFTLRNVLLCVS